MDLFLKRFINDNTRTRIREPVKAATTPRIPACRSSRR